jgi:hypothetical protein
VRNCSYYHCGLEEDMETIVALIDRVIDHTNEEVIEAVAK